MTDPRLRNPPLAETAAQLHLVRCFADEINERNFADKRLYLLQAIDRLSSALSAIPLPTEGQPGWKLVPIEPKPEMLGAWYRYKNGHHWPDEPPPRDTSDYGAYRAMLAASPSSTSGGGE